MKQPVRPFREDGSQVFDVLKQTFFPERLRILALDFDGVLHDRPRTPDGHAVIDGPVVPGATDFIVRAVRLFEVNIYSCRSAEPEGIAAMQGWLLERMIEAHDDDGYTAFHKIRWPVFKPPAFVSIDDRGLTFTGTFPDPASLLDFKPWNRLPALAPKIHWSRR